MDGRRQGEGCTRLSAAPLRTLPSGLESPNLQADTAELHSLSTLRQLGCRVSGGQERVPAPSLWLLVMT